MHPTVEDRADSVSLGLHPKAATAEAITRTGLTRLAALTLPQQHALVRRNAASDRELTLWLAAAGLGRDVFDELADRAVATAVLNEQRPLPRTEVEFAAQIEEGRSEIAAAGDEAIRVVRATAQGLAQTRSGLAALSSSAFVDARTSILADLARLTAPGWVRLTPAAWFRQLPKYAQAAARRVARLPQDAARDQPPRRTGRTLGAGAHGVGGGLDRRQARSTARGAALGDRGIPSLAPRSGAAHARARVGAAARSAPPLGAPVRRVAIEHRCRVAVSQLFMQS